MKHTNIVVSMFLITVWTFLHSTDVTAQVQSVMTYNIRYGTAKDGDDIWNHRKESLAREIAFYEPDFFGVQEALHFQMVYLDSLLPQYSFTGVGRDDGMTEGEYSAIFYHTGRVKLLKAGTFWLSETPDKISKGWDAALPRICTYGHFEYRKRKKNKIWYFNTHFDHRGDLARIESVDLIIKKVNEMARTDEPVIISGDFNLEPESPPIQKMSKAFNDSYTSSKLPPFGPSTTFQGFDIEATSNRRIDYIFGNDHVEVEKTAILSTGLTVTSTQIIFQC